MARSPPWMLVLLITALNGCSALAPTRLFDNHIFRPPPSIEPRAYALFLGGAFVGAAPALAYRNLLTRLARCDQANADCRTFRATLVQTNTTTEASPKVLARADEITGLGELNIEDNEGKHAGYHPNSTWLTSKH